ncbi:MAG: polyprenyl synthetase family protein [Lachnospiraceae bacterium]|nr:polyprenyl synthetase family protein [Lachnospiraceae bacterium]
MDFKKELSERQSEVNNIISAYLPEETGYQKTVIEAMNYSVRAGGKRLRPVMMHELYRIFSDANGEKEDESLIGPFLAAIEMIHTYSLVHDDLPAMDNDSLRRGLPTTHVKFGHAMGVLAGDGLLNYSVETACRAFELGKNDEKSTERNLRVMRALKILYEKAGIYGMIGGQTLDVLKDGQPLDADEIAFIYDNKTCALIEAAVLCGAVLGGAEEKDLAALSEMSVSIGRAFQIMDDILDIVADEKVLGKPVGSDAKNKKSTYAAIHGVEESRKKVKEYTDRALFTADGLKDGEFLKKLIKSLAEREY